MKSSKKLQVFISSTFEDMKEERQAAVEAVLEAGHIPAGMELFSAGTLDQMKTIQRWIEDSDVYMLVLGGRYGSIEPISRKSYIECEFDFALSVGKPIFSLVISPALLDAKVRRLGIRTIEQGSTESLELFKKKVLSRLCAFFNNIEELQKESIKSLLAISREYDLTGWVRADDPDLSAIGVVQNYYYPFLDPMKVKGGRVVKAKKSENTWNPYIFTAKFVDSESCRFIFGPYRTLPAVGKYKVSFRIKLDGGTFSYPPDDTMLMLDVYDYYGGRVTYAQRILKASDLSHEFKTFSLDFLYASIYARLEYRVGYMGSASRTVAFYVDQIVVERSDHD